MPAESSEIETGPWDETPHQVLLCNFGGPTKREDVQPFLTNLFHDPLLIRAPTLIRKLIAWQVVSKRAPKVTTEYEKIGFSPINRYTEAQAQSLEQLLQQKRKGARVYVVNRYTPPFAAEVIPKLNFAGTRTFAIALYPHFSHSTTGSSFRDLDLALRMVGEPPVTKIFSWWHHAGYAGYSFARIDSELRALSQKVGQEPITVMCSAHGIPLRYHLRGDPYVHDTRAHFNDWRQRASLQPYADQCRWQLTFQSRVGRMEWVKPYTEVELERLGKERGGHLLMVPISFTSDHIETLYEMDVTYQEVALNSGFTSYQRVSAANEDPEFSRCLASVLADHGF